MPSEIAGTGALWVALAIALVIALARRPNAEQMARAAPWALTVLAIQSLHFGEEFATGFHERFPAILGLEPWTPTFFVGFNVGWIAAWSLAVAAATLRRYRLGAAWLLWFLALSATANGVAHPVLAAVAREYFPGLLTSPILGLAGIALIRALMRPAAA